MSQAQTDMQTTNIAQLQNNIVANNDSVEIGFNSTKGFEMMQRIAKMLSDSSLVPAQYRNIVVDKTTKREVINKTALPNCIIALNMANRMKADPLMVMQNLYIVEGKPAWSATSIIAFINSSGKFTPLRFELIDMGEEVVKYQETVWGTSPNGQRQSNKVEKELKIQNICCKAWATDQKTGVKLESPTISMKMAVLEGWYQKNGSKWQTMPELMLRYRAASFFGKMYAPELLMGLQSEHEVIDVTDTYEVVANNEVNTISSSDFNQVKIVELEAVQTPLSQEPEPTTPPLPPKQSEKKTPKSTQTQTQAPKEQTTEPEKDNINMILCPNTEWTKQVNELDCASKSCRAGCPAFDGDNPDF
ncbi:hypothetical protein [Desulfovibrio litoralis]|uniref:Uncharacterized protein n=1 Tax=Desulfovibrio litoralis DSM 11393 TaxID=1121455 RepID=A0A1M7T7I4_9BACT|nr:hypothetical protein [Desulfovibrio litoralis]SHN66683.1 hypothetical protein SAMN02745728_01675 [Desulfovibrio litoralis DSM 11393]